MTQTLLKFLPLHYVMKVLPSVAYCINLDRRTDRWEQVQKDIAQLPFELRRVSAIENKSSPQDGFAETFKGILRDDEPYTLIIEDDLQVLSPTKVLQALTDVPDDWDILLGGSYGFKSDCKVVKKHWIKCTNFCSSHFIIIRNRVYDIIRRIHNNGSHFDTILGSLSKSTFNTYLMYRMPCCQRPGYSDMRKKNVNDNNRDLPWI